MPSCQPLPQEPPSSRRGGHGRYPLCAQWYGRALLQLQGGSYHWVSTQRGEGVSCACALGARCRRSGGWLLRESRRARPGWALPGGLWGRLAARAAPEPGRAGPPPQAALPARNGGAEPGLCAGAAFGARRGAGWLSVLALA